MRKNIIYLLTCLVTMAVSAGLVSCSSDDDGLDSPIAKEIIGTWYASDNSVNRECTVTFYSDGTGSFMFDMDAQTVIWNDDKENAASGMIFELTNINGTIGR